MTSSPKPSKQPPSAALTEIARLDPATDHTTIVQLTIGDGLLWDFVRSLELALFRTYAVPSIGRLLNTTGEFARNGQKRYDDTTLLLLGILREGYNRPTGQAAIDRMNRTHGHYRISNDDFLFVLSTFVLDPIRWARQYSWRALVPKEEEALFLVWRNIGLRMGLGDVPDTLKQMEADSDAYVDTHFAYDPANQAVGAATLDIVKGWLRGVAMPLRGAVQPAAAVLLDNKTRQALGIPTPSRAVCVATISALKARAAAMRAIPALRRINESDWPDGRQTYPNGYNIAALAPERLLAAEKHLSAKLD